MVTIGGNGTGHVNIQQIDGFKTGFDKVQTVDRTNG